MKVRLLEASQKAEQNLIVEDLLELKKELEEIDDETSNKYSQEKGINLKKRLDNIIENLVTYKGHVEALIKDKRAEIRRTALNKRVVYRYLSDASNRQALKETKSSVVYMVVGIVFIVFFCILETIAISTLLEFYVPGFAGDNMNWKRIAVGCIAILVNLAIKYAIECHESNNLKNITKNVAIFSAFAFLGVFFMSFFAEQLIGHLGEGKNLSFDANENISDIIQIGRMTALFLASFSGAYLVSDIPAREIRGRNGNGLKRVNPAYEAMQKDIDAAKSAIGQRKREVKEMKRILTRAREKRDRIWSQLISSAQKEAVKALEIQS